MGHEVRLITKSEAASEVEKDNVIKIYTEKRNYFIVAISMIDAIEWSIVLRKSALLFNGKTLYVEQFCGGDQKTKFEHISHALAKGFFNFLFLKHFF